MCPINKIITFVTILSSGFLFCCETPPIPKSYHLIHSRRYLYNSVPSEFKGQVTYYRALLEQTSPDDHSCGQRAVFHALALEHAMQKVHRGIPMGLSLRSSFSNMITYEWVALQINHRIQKDDPLFDIKDGTHGNQLARAGNTEFPQLYDKLLPIYLSKNTLDIIDNGNPPYPATLNADKYSPLFNTKYKPLSNSGELYLQLSKLRRPFDIIHFPALLDNQHWVLASVMLNYKCERRLLAIDSCNIFLQNYPSLQTLIRLLNKEIQ